MIAGSSFSLYVGLNKMLVLFTFLDNISILLSSKFSIIDFAYIYYFNF
jgi:hypothetical protein